MKENWKKELGYWKKKKKQQKETEIDRQCQRVCNMSSGNEGIKKREYGLVMMLNGMYTTKSVPQ